jgi:hypothetical protein
MAMENAAMKPLPSGTANFDEFAKRGYVYADKTDLIHELIMDGGPFFLSRPRRFGKSLLLSTIEAILLGQEKLFKGLKIDHLNYHWEHSPVVHLRLATINSKSIESLRAGLLSRLARIARREHLALDGTEPSEALLSLFDALYSKYNTRVSVLIDEYDQPILNQLENAKLAKDVRDELRLFYGALKDTDRRGFTFITGVAKLNLTNLFSALNDLEDLTLQEKYAGICGFAVEEFDTLFSGHLEASLTALKSKGTLLPDATVSKLRETMFKWYDGYTWDGKTRILNPWSIISFFKQNAFSYHWIETGAAGFLERLHNMGILDSRKVTEPGSITRKANVMDLDSRLNAVPLLFQAGYLTVERVEGTIGGVDRFYLAVPNNEVGNGLVPLLFHVPSADDPAKAKAFSDSLLSSLLNLDALGLQRSFSGYLAQCNCEGHIPNEAYCRSQFRAAMFLAGAETEPGEPAADGRIDVLYKAKNGANFAIELKYCPRTTTGRHDGKGQSKEDDEALDEKLKEDMQAALLAALKQTDCKQCTQRFGVEGAAVQKVALVAGGRTQALCAFKQEDSI